MTWHGRGDRSRGLQSNATKRSYAMIASRSHDTLNTTKWLSTGRTLPVDEYVVQVVSISHWVKPR